MTAPADIPPARARELVGLFHPAAERFGEFAAVAAPDVPPAARRLLDHTSHMTVAMERFHGNVVDLDVVARTDCPDGRYAREILLRLPDGRVVQHGIVRIDLDRLGPTTAAAIRGETLPLGRILLATGRLCEVHDVHLLRVVAGPHLAGLFSTANATELFGRVAMIDLDGRPAIELLEISAPLPP